MNKTKAFGMIVVIVVMVTIVMGTWTWFYTAKDFENNVTEKITNTYCLKHPSGGTTNGHSFEVYRLIHSNGSFLSGDYGIVEIHTKSKERNYTYIIYNPYTREVILNGRVTPEEGYMEGDWRYGRPEYSYIIINHIPTDSSLTIRDDEGGYVMGINAAPKGRNVSFTKIFLDYENGEK